MVDYTDEPVCEGWGVPEDGEFERIILDLPSMHTISLTQGSRVVDFSSKQLHALIDKLYWLDEHSPRRTTRSRHHLPLPLASVSNGSCREH